VLALDFSYYDVSISTEYGLIWDGYVIRHSYNGETLKIDCVGKKNKLNDTFYQGYFDSGWGSNSSSIIRDILKDSDAVDANTIDLTPYGTTMAQLADMTTGPTDGIDRDRSIMLNQVTSYGGIGIQDFSADPVKSIDALNKILSLGTYDDTYDALVVQILEYGTAITKRIPKDHESATCDWYVAPQNIIVDTRQLEYTVDRSDFATAYTGIYRTSDGSSVRTPLKIDLKNIERFGVIEKVISDGDLSKGEMLLVLEAKSRDKTSEMSVGNLSLNGLVKRAGGQMYMPAYAIRAGDALRIPARNSSASSISSSDASYETIIVGSIEADLVTGETNITPYNSPESIEYVMRQLDIGTA
jgi:hypothetical protein